MATDPNLKCAVTPFDLLHHHDTNLKNFLFISHS